MVQANVNPKKQILIQKFVKLSEIHKMDHEQGCIRFDQC